MISTGTLPPSQYKAIRSLRNNPEIIVRPADIGGCVTVLNTQDYIAEAENQLNDFRFYRQITDFPSFSTQFLEICVTHSRIIFYQLLGNLYPATLR